MSKYNTKLFRNYIDSETLVSGDKIGITKAKLAIKASVSMSMIEKLYAGTYKKNIKESRALALANAMNVNVTELVKINYAA